MSRVWRLCPSCGNDVSWKAVCWDCDGKGGWWELVDEDENEDGWDG